MGTREPRRRRQDRIGGRAGARGNDRGARPVVQSAGERLVDAAQDAPLDAALSMSTRAQQEIFESDDLHEGVAAFSRQARPREFKGRSTEPWNSSRQTKQRN